MRGNYVLLTRKIRQLLFSFLQLLSVDRDAPYEVLLLLGLAVEVVRGNALVGLVVHRRYLKPEKIWFSALKMRISAPNRTEKKNYGKNKRGLLQNFLELPSMGNQNFRFTSLRISR